MSEVCASRIPTKQEDDLASSAAERIQQLSNLGRVLTMEIAYKKSALKTSAARVKKAKDVVSAHNENLEFLDRQIEELKGDNWCNDNPELEFRVGVFNRMKGECLEKIQTAVEDVTAAEAAHSKVRETIELQGKQLTSITDEASHLKLGGRPSGLHPWPMLYPRVEEEEIKVESVEFSTCTLCDYGFPNRDIIVATCSHAYHPWCAFAVFGKGLCCVQENCKRPMHPSWRRSFGWGHQAEELQQGAASLGIDGEFSELLQDREDFLKSIQRECGKPLKIRLLFCVCVVYSAVDKVDCGILCS